MVVGQRCSVAHTQCKHPARGSVDRGRGRNNVYPWDTNKQQHLAAAAAAAVKLTTSTYLIPMRDHCALSSHSAYALRVCVCTTRSVCHLRGTCRPPASQPGRQRDRPGWPGDGQPESWKAGQPSVLATFRGCKIMSNQFRVGRGCRNSNNSNNNKCNQTKICRRKIVLARVFIVVQPGDLT